MLWTGDHLAQVFATARGPAGPRTLALDEYLPFKGHTRRVTSHPWSVVIVSVHHVRFAIPETANWQEIYRNNVQESTTRKADF